MNFSFQTLNFVNADVEPSSSCESAATRTDKRASLLSLLYTMRSAATFLGRRVALIGGQRAVLPTAARSQQFRTSQLGGDKEKGTQTSLK